MEMFLKITGIAIVNVENITHIVDGGSHVAIYLIGVENPLKVRGEEAKRVLNWFNQRADQECVK